MALLSVDKAGGWRRVRSWKKQLEITGGTQSYLLHSRRHRNLRTPTLASKKGVICDYCGPHNSHISQLEQRIRRSHSYIELTALAMQNFSGICKLP